MLSRILHPRLDRVVALFALLLAVAWLPITSHELLESAGLIHQDEGLDGDEGPAHDAADGLCQLHHGGISLKAPTWYSLGWLVTAIELSVAALFVVFRASSHLRWPTESPPGVAGPWQFVLRLALPSRAPSFAL
jgi:hypothetical protein